MSSTAKDQVSEFSRAETQKVGEPEMEDQARAAWKAALGIDELTAESNFFDLGGDSAAALSVIMALEEDHDIFVEADILFSNPNFGDFVNALQAAADEQDSFEL